MRNKRKGILMASAILGSAAIVSTGFAAWVITTTTTVETPVGNIEVDAVDDNRITISTPVFVGENGEDSTVTFGHKAATVSNPWLTNDAEDAEDLDVQFKFTASWNDSTKSATSIVLNYQFNTLKGSTVVDKNGVDSGFDALNTYSTYTLIDEATISVTGATIDTVAKTITCTHGQEVTVTIAFGWGSAFGDLNPYQYFNTLKTATPAGYLAATNPTPDEIDEAIERLKAIKTNIDPLTFKMILSNKPITD